MEVGRGKEGLTLTAKEESEVRREFEGMTTCLVGDSLAIRAQICRVFPVSASGFCGAQNFHNLGVLLKKKYNFGIKANFYLK